MCPIIHFFAIAFADNAFHQNLFTQGLNATKMHSFQNPESRITFEFKSKDEILNVPVFHKSYHDLTSVHTHPNKTLSASDISSECRHLSQRIGLPYHFKPYYL